MVRVCTVCTSPNKGPIEKEMIERTGSDRSIAKKYGVSVDAIYRHRVNHLPAHVERAREVGLVWDSAELTARAQALYNEAEDLLRQAKAEGKISVAIQAARAAMDGIKLLQGRPETQVNVGLQINDVQAVHSKIADALADYPEARAKVLTALGEMP